MSIMKRKLRLTTHSSISVLIVLGLLIIINSISSNKFVRLDLTENKQFTIAEATKKIISELDDRVTIKLFFSDNLPPVMMVKERLVRDILDEYKAFSNGNIVIKKEDPASDPDLEKQVQSMGIPQVQMTFREKDKVEVKNGYLGIGIFFEDKKEVLPIVQSEFNLEYDLTSAIKKVTTDTVLKAGFLTGHEERDITTEYAPIAGALKQQYEVTTVSIENGQSVPDDISVLIIAGPKKDFSKRDLFEIDQYVMKGGKLIVLMDTVSINFEMGLMAMPQKNSLTKLIESYGARINTDLVLDRYNDRLTYSESPDNRMQYITSVNYPFFVKVLFKNFAEDSPVLRGFQSLTLPWTSSINILKHKLKNVEATELLKSSEFSWTQNGQFSLNPKQRFIVPPDQEKQLLLAAVLTGEFTSHFEGKSIPTVQLDNDSAQPIETPDDANRTIIEQSPTTQIFVMGSSYFLTNDSLRRFNTNAVLFLNTVDWLAQGEDLIGIRTRAIAEHPIRELSPKTTSFLKLFNIFGISALVICAGLFLLYRRNRIKKLYESMLLR